MKNIRAIKVLLVAVLVPCAALLRCGANPNSGGTETGDSRIASMLYNPDGSPAKNAKVVFYPVNYNPRTGGLGKTAAMIDSTTTDTNGNYVAMLNSGTYNILANGDSGLAFQDSITTIKGDTVKPPADTLHAPGTIQGIVQLQPGDDARTVFVLFMGTHTFTMPTDSIGNFTSDNMAAGHYSVRIITTTPNYKVLDTNLSVTAGTVNVLPQPIVLKFTGIPTPSNVKISYDTLIQVVTLTWARPDTSLVKGYNVYRRDIDSSYGQTPINGTTLVRDTMYRDTTGIQDKTYEYKVVAIDKGDNPGKMSAGVRVVIASYFVLDSTFGAYGSGQGQLRNPSDIAIASNGDIYIVDQDNNRVQVFDQAMQYKREFGGGILSVPFRIALDSLGNAYVSASGNIFVFDPAGTIIDTLVIGKFVHDFDLGINEFYAITDGDSVSVFSYNGTLKRTWWCSEYQSAICLTIQNPDRILVGSRIEDKLRVFDTLGSIVDSIDIGPWPYCFALDKTNGRIFINCSYNTLDDRLKVLDGSHRLLAIYKLPGPGGGGFSIGLHPDGSIYEVFPSGGGSIQILRLRSLLP